MCRGDVCAGARHERAVPAGSYYINDRSQATSRGSRRPTPRPARGATKRCTCEARTTPSPSVFHQTIDPRAPWRRTNELDASAVIEMYARGGRLITSGPWAGDGAINPNKSSLVRGFALSPQERADLLEWLGSLSDPTFGEDLRFADPWMPP
jgi:hypothetical protein